MAVTLQINVVSATDQAPSLKLRKPPLLLRIFDV